MSKLNIFVHIEKTGGTSIIKLLRSHLILKHVDLIPFRNAKNSACVSDLKLARIAYPMLRTASAHGLRIYDKEWQAVDTSFSSLLREPSQRYISDFFHFTRHMGFPNDFELWLRWSSRHNHQVRSLVGTDDASSAIAAYKNSQIFLDILPNIESFSRRLLEMAGCDYNPEENLKEVVNKGNYSAKDIESKFKDEIHSVNSCDYLLYEYVENNPPLIIQNSGAQKLTNSNFALRTGNNISRIWRSAIYKPLCIVHPLKTHGLRQYIEYQKLSDRQWREYIEATANDG